LALVFFSNIDALNGDAALLGKDFYDLAAFAFVVTVATDNLNRITSADLNSLRFTH
jgi:hypothetical protein